MKVRITDLPGWDDRIVAQREGAGQQAKKATGIRHQAREAAGTENMRRIMVLSLEVLLPELKGFRSNQLQDDSHRYIGVCREILKPHTYSYQ